MQETGRDQTDCESALVQSEGNLMSALALLEPTGERSPFHDAYHLGPYRRVQDPDRDLPKREGNGPADDSYVMVKNMGGQRCIPPFRDSNELGDILGLLYSANSYPKWEDWMRFEGPTIQGCLMMATDRIRDKIKRNKNPARGALFSEALNAVVAASDLYFDGKYEEASELIWRAVRALQDGNRLRKAHA